MPPLKNPKHEAFAQEYSRQIIDPKVNPSGIKSYQASSGSDWDNAHSHAHRVVANGGVQRRMGELLEDAGAGRKKRSRWMKDLAHSQDEWMRLASIKEMNRVDGLTDQPDQTNINVPEGIAGLVDALAQIKAKMVAVPNENSGKTRAV